MSLSLRITLGLLRLLLLLKKLSLPRLKKRDLALPQWKDLSRPLILQLLVEEFLLHLLQRKLLKKQK